MSKLLISIQIHEQADYFIILKLFWMIHLEMGLDLIAADSMIRESLYRTQNKLRTDSLNVHTTDGARTRQMYVLMIVNEHDCQLFVN